MRQFPVDDEVVEAVWTRADPKPFENLSFNSALRRVLGLQDGSELRDPSPTPPAGATPIGGNNDLDELLKDAMAARPRGKAPKTDMRELIKAGLVRNGEELCLVDYQGARVHQYRAIVAGGLLQYKGQHYSMSDLARDLLKKVGYQSDSVRGPAHWVNAKGVIIKDLWQQLLEKRARK